MIGFQLGIFQGCSADVWQLLVVLVSPLQTPGSSSVCLSSMASPGAVKGSALFIVFWKLPSCRKAGNLMAHLTWLSCVRDHSDDYLLLNAATSFCVRARILCLTMSEANPTGFHLCQGQQSDTTALERTTHIFKIFQKGPNNLVFHSEIFLSQ